MRYVIDVSDVRFRTNRWLHRCALIGSLTLASGCMGNTQEEPAAEPVPPTYVKVENHAYLDMNIFVYRSSQRTRLGTANGNSSARFLIPSSLLFGATPLRFLADPIGSRRSPISEEITVAPGDEVQLVIPPT